MTVNLALHESRRLPEPAALLTLLKPVTWFPPMWAYLCGIVSAGVWPGQHWGLVLLGVLLAGPVVCGMSQAANDWFDRHVDAINEPHRPIPSGRIPGAWGLYVALAMSALGLLVGWQLGPWGFGATLVAVAAAWAYSAPPVRLKRSGWWGPMLVAFAYEGLPWFTGAAVLSAGAPSFFVIVVAVLYAGGAQGIMVLNDFKAVEGDRATGIRSMVVLKGPEIAARICCAVMILPQTLVVAMLVIWGQPFHAAAILALIVCQGLMMRRFLAEPTGRALWYSACGVPLYVTGMMVAAVAIRGLAL